MEFNTFRNIVINELVNILDGRWLFKYLTLDIVKYIVCNKNEKMEEQELSILVNENNALITGIIKELSEIVHNINIITKDIRLFQKLKTEIYNENGMLLNVSNNYKKSAIRSKIILNFGFLKKDLEKVNILRKAVIVNLIEGIKLDKKSFDGIICNFYYISFSYNRYQEFQKKLNHFNKTTVYESLIYKQTYRGNIKKKEFQKISNL